MKTEFFTPTDTENLKKSLSVGMLVKVNGHGILRISGIYDKLFTGVDNKLKSWDTCKKQVDGYSNPKFKKFENIDSALGYLNKHGIRVKERK